MSVFLQDTRATSSLFSSTFSWSSDIYAAQLLSKIFSQMWNTDLDASDSSVIHQALSSPLYPQCVDAYRKLRMSFHKIIHVDLLAEGDLKFALCPTCTVCPANQFSAHFFIMFVVIHLMGFLH